MRGVEPRLRFAAYHEAGHAFVAYVLGQPYAAIEVLLSGDGRVHPPPLSDSREKFLLANHEALVDLAIRDLIATVAGPLAELRAGGIEAEVEKRARGDVARTFLMLKSTEAENEMGAVGAAADTARELIEIGWPVIEAIASELCRRKKLTGREVESIISAGIDFERQDRA
jgi:hypothetical protein